MFCSMKKGMVIWVFWLVSDLIEFNEKFLQIFEKVRNYDVLHAEVRGKNCQRRCYVIYECPLVAVRKKRKLYILYITIALQIFSIIFLLFSYNLELR